MFNISSRNLLANAGWALKRTWSTNAPLTAGLIGVTLLQSVMPAGLALTARGLINALVAVLNSASPSISLLLPWLLLGLGLTLIEGIGRIANNLFTRRLYDDLNLRIPSDILAHAADLDVSFFEDPRFQDVMERTQQNTAGHFCQFITNILALATNLIQMVSLGAILIMIEPFVALILAVVGLPYLFFHWRFAQTRYLTEHSRATKHRWTRYFVSRLTGQQSVAETKLLDLAPLLRDQFRSLMTGFRDEDRKLHVRGFASNSLFVVIATVALYAMFVRVALRALAGTLTVGDVAIYGGATSGLRRALENTVLSVGNVLEQTLHITNLIEFLNLKPKMADPCGPTPSSTRGEIELRDVSFTYSGCRQPSLSGISLHIRPGETIALVGENGAGKSTLVKLIARLYDPDHGCITFDGVDLKELSFAFLHGEISFVPQNFGRYETTASENIAYGDWRRMMRDREGVKKVAHLANVHEMITAMPQAYDTLLGRMFGDYNPSEGQWQRIAVARAFARDASLLILDEPTSNLDARAEHELFSGFRELARGRTTILISHRFSTVSMADRIVVMDKGKIVERGTHHELLVRAGHYASLYDLHQRQMAQSIAE
jgi:ATP-binding cassette subfamily B protein